jgi:hypothetical protein
MVEERPPEKPFDSAQDKQQKRASISEELALLVSSVLAQ